MPCCSHLKPPKEVMEFIKDCLPGAGHLLTDVALNLVRGF